MYVVSGSIQERADNKLYNMAAAYVHLGQMVAKYRKMLLVVIDIPGRITFREPGALTEGSELATFDTGV